MGKNIDKRVNVKWQRTTVRDSQCVNPVYAGRGNGRCRAKVTNETHDAHTIVATAPIVFDESATVAKYEEATRREKQEEDAGAKNKAYRRYRRYELHCFTVVAPTRVY